MSYLYSQKDNGRGQKEEGMKRLKESKPLPANRLSICNFNSAQLCPRSTWWGSGEWGSVHIKTPLSNKTVLHPH